MTDAKMPPRVSVWQDDSGKIFASSREEYSRDIFDYDKQNGTFEYLSLQEAERMLSQARAEALRDAVAYLKSEYEGCQEGTLVSYHVASEILRIWAENDAKAAAPSGAGEFTTKEKE